MSLSYKTVETFAHAYVDLQRQVRGDAFAMETEMVSIHADIFGWLDLWQDALSAAIGRKVSKHTISVDHSRKTITVSE